MGHVKKQSPVIILQLHVNKSLCSPGQFWFTGPLLWELITPERKCLVFIYIYNIFLHLIHSQFDEKDFSLEKP